MVDIVGVDEEGWFRGRIGQNEGVFPSNFVEEEQESALPPRAASPEPAPPEIPAVDSQTGERRTFYGIYTEEGRCESLI